MKTSAVTVVAVALLALALADARPLPASSSAGSLESARRMLKGTVDLNPLAEGVEAYTNAQIGHVNAANEQNEADRRAINASNRNNVNGNSGAIVGSVNKNLQNLGLGAVQVGNGNLGNGR